MTVIDLRESLKLRYHSWKEDWLESSSLLNRSFIFELFNSNKLTAIHLAAANRVNQVFPLFVTNWNESFLQCQYGLSVDILDLPTVGRIDTYQASYICETKG